MSFQYNQYLYDHCHGVGQAFNWLEDNVPEVLKNLDKPVGYGFELTNKHDTSKYSDEEYQAYDNYFYGDKSNKVVKDFDYAWLHHIHNNPPHWQYWVLVGDDEPLKALEMPEEYIIEMICDWFSFSFKNGDLRELFKWYDDHKAKMILHPKTKSRVEEILDAIDKKLKENEEFQNEETNETESETTEESQTNPAL